MGAAAAEREVVLVVLLLLKMMLINMMGEYFLDPMGPQGRDGVR